MAVIRRYRKRPVVVSAVQLTPDNVDSVMKWIGKKIIEIEQTFDDGLVIPTEEGNMLASWGDWVIQGVEGEHYPCKPSIFEATYEEANDGD